MSGKRRVLRIAAPPTTRVRYGRATLTIAQTGGIVMSEFGDAVADYESGELAAEQLCERFVRMRVKEHSPSFSWDEADLTRVLKLVVETSEEPRFKSPDDEHVADRLVAAVAEERGAAGERKAAAGSPASELSQGHGPCWDQPDAVATRLAEAPAQGRRLA
jgi:hypothetical protein